MVETHKIDTLTYIYIIMIAYFPGLVHAL